MFELNPRIAESVWNKFSRGQTTLKDVRTRIDKFLSLPETKCSWPSCLGEIRPPTRVTVKPENRHSTSGAPGRTRSKLSWNVAELEPVDDDGEEEDDPPLKRTRSITSNSEDVMDLDEMFESLAHELPPQSATVIMTPKRKLSFSPINEKRDHGKIVSKVWKFVYVYFL